MSSPSVTALPTPEPAHFSPPAVHSDSIELGSHVSSSTIIPAQAQTIHPHHAPHPGEQHSHGSAIAKRMLNVVFGTAVVVGLIGTGIGLGMIIATQLATNRMKDGQSAENGASDVSNLGNLIAGISAVWSMVAGFSWRPVSDRLAAGSNASDRQHQGQEA